MIKIEKFIQRKKLEAYKTDMRGLIRPVMLMNELQFMAGAHAEIIGAGRGISSDKKVGWIVTHWAVEISELPKELEELTWITWPAVRDAVKSARDFRVLNADGRELIRASSQWIVMNLETRRPMRISDAFEDWDVLPERALAVEFDKFPDFEATDTKDFKIRYDDIDVNQHVNNAVYAIWATESLGIDFLENHKLKGIKINFKKEIPAGTKDVSITYRIDGNTTRHLIKTDPSSPTPNAIVILDWE